MNKEQREISTERKLRSRNESNTDLTLRRDIRLYRPFAKARNWRDRSVAFEVMTRTGRPAKVPFSSCASSRAEYPALQYRLRPFWLRQRWFQEFRQTALTVGTR